MKSLTLPPSALPITLFLVALLGSFPAAAAPYSDGSDYYGYGRYGDGYGASKSYQSYSRSYDTKRSDIVSHTLSHTGSDSASGNRYPYNSYRDGYGPYGSSPYGAYNTFDGYDGNGNWYSYQGAPSYPEGYSSGGYSSGYPGYADSGYLDGYYRGYVPPYYPPSSRSYSNTFTDNYNRQYNEHTNENIKVDKFIRYDDVGVVHLVSGDIYGGRRPYYISYDNYLDPYTYRYPYSGLSTGDTGYFAQPYYRQAAVQLPPSAIIPPLTRYGEQIDVVPPSITGRQSEGPSQGYMNQITDRGPLYASLKPYSPPNKSSLPPPSISSATFRFQALQNQDRLQNQESGQALRNPYDTSVYDGQPERDSAYVYPYMENQKRR